MKAPKPTKSTIFCPFFSFVQFVPSCFLPPLPSHPLRIHSVVLELDEVSRWDIRCWRATNQQSKKLQFFAENLCRKFTAVSRVWWSWETWWCWINGWTLRTWWLGSCKQILLKWRWPSSSSSTTTTTTTPAISLGSATARPVDFACHLSRSIKNRRFSLGNVV